LYEPFVARNGKPVYFKLVLAVRNAAVLDLWRALVLVVARGAVRVFFIHDSISVIVVELCVINNVHTISNFIRNCFIGGESFGFAAALAPA
jgi:hypothetical protein